MSRAFPPAGPLRSWPLPSCSALGAALGNALSGTPAPWQAPLAVLDHGEVKGTVRARPLPVPASPAAGDGERAFIPRCRGTLLWQGGVWRWALDSLHLLRLHPALHPVPVENLSALPDELRLAVLELLLEPLLDTAAQALGSPAKLGECLLTAEDDEVSAPFAPLELWLDAGEHLRERVLLRLTPPDMSAVRALARVLRPPAARLAPPWTRVPLPVAVVAGYVRLPPAELTALAIGHILLPDDYFAARGLAQLRLTSRRGRDDGVVRVIPCTVSGRALTVSGPPVATPCMESAMSETSLTPPSDAVYSDGNAPAGAAFAPERLEVDVCFELERRLMTLEELSSLAPGSVLTLTADLHAPVTLRAQGKAVGTGRLVDVDGVLGVQILSLG